MSEIEKTNNKYFSAYLIMLISSIISLISSFVLSLEALTLAENANATLACNINELISCGKVAKSWQSNLLGFPNPFLGLICEPVVITVAISGMMGVKFPKKFMQIASFFYGLGLLFALWLFSQSLFVIKAFCPWCLLVTFSTITVFTSLLKVNLLEDNFSIKSEKLKTKIANFYQRNLDIATTAILYGSILILIMFKYHQVLF
jgi:uncharacterized membrane protein